MFRMLPLTMNTVQITIKQLIGDGEIQLVCFIRKRVSIIFFNKPIKSLMIHTHIDDFIFFYFSFYIAYHRNSQTNEIGVSFSLHGWKYRK